MIATLQLVYGRAYEILTRISPASWIFDRTARLFVGAPEELQQAPDFWFDNEERALPSRKDYSLPKIQMQQVGSEYFRRSLRRDLAVFSMLAAMALSTAVFSASALGVWMITPGQETSDAEQESAVVEPTSDASVQPATNAIQSSPVKRQSAARAPVKVPEVSPEFCRQLRDDLDPANQRRFITESGVFDQSQACKDQFGI